MNTVDTAREVIRQHGHLDRDELSRREKERLDLARAVLAVADLADTLDEAGKALASMGVHADDRTLYAARIRAALNGDATHG